MKFLMEISETYNIFYGKKNLGISFFVCTSNISLQDAMKFNFGISWSMKKP